VDATEAGRHTRVQLEGVWQGVWEALVALSSTATLASSTIALAHSSAFLLAQVAVKEVRK